MELSLRARKIGRRSPLSWDERVCDPSAGEDWLVVQDVGVGGLDGGHGEQQQLPVYLRCVVRPNGEGRKMQHRVVEALGKFRSLTLRGRHMPGKLLR